MVTIVSREEWGAKPRKKPETDSFSPWLGGTIIHHLGPGKQAQSHHDDCYAHMRDIQNEHMYPPFWSNDDVYDDIAYSYLVCNHGIAFEGRGSRVRSAANGTETPGANQNYFAICGMMGLEDDVHGEMISTIRDMVAWLRANGQAGYQVLGHKDVFNTECPGKLYPYVQSGTFYAPPPGGGDSENPVPPKPGQPLFFYDRSQWGARPPKEVTRVDPSSRTGFTVHYSAGPTSQTVRQIQNYHMDSNGWSDIGYNFLVDHDGRIFEGRGWDVVGAHATGHNTTHIGACFIGYDGDATPRALSALRALYLEANRRTGRTLEKTWHSGLSGQSTQCPGSALRAWVQGGMDAALIPVQGGVGGSSGGSAGGGGGGMTSVRSVAAQQLAVNGMGYSPALDVDGEWGPLTDAGVRWLQGRVGVAADGLWGPATEAAYASGAGGSGGAGGMTSVRSIAAQQRAVNGMGYSPALDVDGEWGPLTDAGVRWLQRQVGADADGLWGPATEAAYDGGLDNGAGLVVDGDFGPSTIRATQRVIGVTADGEWGPDSVRGLQRHLNTWSGAGLVVDGDAGPATYKALQTHLNRMIGAGLAVDGFWGPGTIRALKTALNRGKF
ncbi:N-acetylmuramoyl-L-alanine amidase [Streptomyces sp. NPDC059783]|uniref:peptidoglycan recognition protein family protein n=1 Tax=Streptomyces sp. NPDC059783 TaxID=3346944 RepID=UPI0036525E9F